MKYRRLLAVLQAASENGKNGVAVCKHPDHPQSVLFVVLLLHRPSPPPAHPREFYPLLFQKALEMIDQSESVYDV